MDVSLKYVVKLLEDNKGITPLMLACFEGRLHNVKLLIEEANKNIMSLDQEDEDYKLSVAHATISNTQDQKKRSPLHFAAYRGHLQIVKVLVEEGNASVNLKNGDSKTALVIASEVGALEIVKYLLEKGANVHGEDNQGKAPIIAAVMNGHLHVVSYLLRYGVNPNYKD